MGGYGSGRWRFHSAKVTTNRCYQLDAGWFAKHKAVKECGAGTLYFGAFWVDFKWQALTVTGTLFSFQHTPPRATDSGGWVNYTIRVSTTRMPNGGIRYWFHCPLNGCRQTRVQKLYLSPRGKYFGCRKCNRLAYASSKNSRKAPSFLVKLATAYDMKVSDVVKLLI